MSQKTGGSFVGSMLTQPQKKANLISWIAPVIGILSGYFIWRFLIGSADNFSRPDLAGGFWPHHEGPKWAWARMYQGGIIVPVLIGALLTVLIFVIERWTVIRKAPGTRGPAHFIRQLQYVLAIGNVDTAIRECAIQRGSLGRIMKAGLVKYQEMITADIDKEKKILAIQKEVDETAAIEIQTLEKNLVFLSTIASVATLMGLLGTVIGMITSFAALGESGGGEAAQRLSQGISEALYNTALGIGTSAFSIIMYNVFTTRIDAITYAIGEGGYTLTQVFATLY